MAKNMNEMMGFIPELPTFDENKIRNQLVTKSETELELILEKVKVGASARGNVGEILRREMR